MAATLFLGAAIATIVARCHAGAYAKLEVAILLIDVGVLAVLWLVSLYANRWWPLAATAAQLVSCVGHLAKAIDPSIGALAYAQITFFSGWPTIIALCVPMMWRSKRASVVASWSPLLPPAARRTLTRWRLD